MPRVAAIRVDSPVWLATGAIALAATVAVATVTAMTHRSHDPRGPEVPRGGATPDASGRMLVASEIALALALSLVALLMVRSFVALQRVDLGFTPSGVLLARVPLPAHRYASDASRRAFFDGLVARARALPGVRSAGVISTRPFGGIGPATTASDPRAPRPATEAPVVDVRYADIGLFDALQIRTIRGGLFDEDTTGGAAQAVVSESLARTFWPGEEAVDRPLGVDIYGRTTARVVGVVADVHLMDARTPPRPTVYLSAARFTSDVRDIAVRIDGNPEALVPALRVAVAALDPSVPLYQVVTLPGLVDRSLADRRFTMWLLGLFAALAVTLGAVGTFGVFSADVVRRRKEIGIRLALGADRPRVVALLLRQSLVHASIGVIAGVAIPWLLARAATSLLFGVRPEDPLSFISVVALMLAVATIATLIPSIHAGRQSPLVALRTE